MGDRFNTTTGWVLFAGIIALGLSSIFMRVFDMERPETMGYPIAGVETAGGGDEGPSLATVLNEVTVEQGEKVFAKCTSCHTIESGGPNGIGPNLYGIMGKSVGGGTPGFAYSSALKDVCGNWGFENMSDWLKSPRAFASGTKMSFAGLSSIEDRAAVSVYMNSMGSNLPLPEAPAEPTEAEAEAEDAAEAGEAVEAEAEQDAAAEENEGGE